MAVTKTVGKETGAAVMAEVAMAEGLRVARPPAEAMADGVTMAVGSVAVETAVVWVLEARAGVMATRAGAMQETELAGPRAIGATVRARVGQAMTALVILSGGPRRSLQIGRRR